MTTMISPGDAYFSMIEKTDRELIAIASQPGNGADETSARNILRARMTSSWKGPAG